MHYWEISSENYIKEQDLFFDEYYSKKRPLKIQDYSEGLEVEVFDPKELLNGHKLDGSPYPKWIPDVANSLGKRYKQGILIGFCYSFIDYYYILLDVQSYKIKYENCLTILEEMSIDEQP